MCLLCEHTVRKMLQCTAGKIFPVLCPRSAHWAGERILTMVRGVRQRESTKLRRPSQAKLAGRRIFSFLNMEKEKGHGRKSLAQGACGSRKNDRELQACYLPRVLFDILGAFFSLSWDSNSKVSTLWSLFDRRSNWNLEQLSNVPRLKKLAKGRCRAWSHLFIHSFIHQ